MDKIKRFIDIQVPVSTCNLRCHYCYITQHRLFSSNVPPLKYSPEQIGRALSKERLGGICHFNICGYGETLIPKYMTDVVRKILEQGHYVMIVNNGTMTSRLNEMIQQYPQELKNRLGVKFSFHYLELKKRKLLDMFFSNINSIRNGGCSFSLELTPSDELIPYINEVKDECMKRLGALCHITVARDENVKGFGILTKLSREKYTEIWSQFNSPLFDFKIKIFNQKRNEFCYAGMWGGILELGTGVLRACDCTFLRQNILDNPEKPINFKPIGVCNKEQCHNGHAWLGLGMIPELDTPSYADMRDRVDKNGHHWLRPDMYSFLSSKLEHLNRDDMFNEYEKKRIRKKANIQNHIWNIREILIGSTRKKLSKVYHAIRK